MEWTQTTARLQIISVAVRENHQPDEFNDVLTRQDFGYQWRL
jgi:hypothetical protein